MLCAWYPFINDSHNQGLAEADLSWAVAPTYSTGLIGGAMVSNGHASISAAQNANIMNNSAISVCFWIYVDAPEGDTSKRATIWGNESGKRHYPIFQYPTCNDLHLSWYTYDSSWNGSAWSSGKVVVTTALIGVLPSYKWTHVAVTYDNPDVKVYVNGELQWSASGVMQSVSFADLTYYAYPCTYRKICDLRVYNHCISPKEVSEIAKGLVLHYPLAMPGQGNNIKASTIHNRGCNGFSYSSATNTWIMTAPIGSTAWGYGIVIDDASIKWKSGESWVVSMEVYVPKAISWNHDINNKPDVSDTSPYTGNDYDDQRLYCSNGVMSSHNLLAGWNKIWFTQRAPATYGLFNYSTNFGIVTTNETSAIDIHIRNIKGEIISAGLQVKPTPWVPHPADTEYAALGFDDGIEYDVSGYQHNGTKVGTITYDVDTPRYNTSTVLDETYITLAGITDQAIPQFSVCGWVNLLTGYTANYGCHLINFNKTYCRICISKDSAAVRLLLTDDTTNYSASSVMSASSLSANVWNHYAVTFDNGSIKIYINGELDSSITATITSISPGSSWTIGNHGSAELPKAKVSDVRFYMTCLNESDVRELYNTSMSLSNNGVLFGYEFIE